jgi:hypothetical protein
MPQERYFFLSFGSTAQFRLSVSLLLLDLQQSVGLLGWVISSAQGLYPYIKKTQ